MPPTNDTTDPAKPGRVEGPHEPEAFGPAAHTPHTAEAAVIDVLCEAPDPVTRRDRPTVKRVLSSEGGNLIAFTFAPGQCLPEHKAAHPITVQCLTGNLTFSYAGRTVELAPGVVVYLPAYEVHRVDCPEGSSCGENVLLLTMLTRR